MISLLRASHITKYLAFTLIFLVISLNPSPIFGYHALLKLMQHNLKLIHNIITGINIEDMEMIINNTREIAENTKYMMELGNINRSLDNPKEADDYRAISNKILEQSKQLIYAAEDKNIIGTTDRVGKLLQYCTECHERFRNPLR